MFAINSFTSQIRLLEDINEENLGTQSRIYDYNTGIFTRILPTDSEDGKYLFTETGIGTCGIFAPTYRFAEILISEGFTKSDQYKLINKIKTSIDGARLNSDEVNNIIQNGFLDFLDKKNPDLSKQKEFQILLKAERLLKAFENNGKIEAEDVLQEINSQLTLEDLTEEDRKIFEQLKYLYKSQIFRIGQQEKIDLMKQHTAQEISEDLGEIGRIGSKTDVLTNMVESEKPRILMTNMFPEIFDENGLMFGQYTIEEIKSYYETFKDDYDSEGNNLKGGDGSVLDSMIYYYTQYLKAISKEEKSK